MFFVRCIFTNIKGLSNTNYVNFRQTAVFEVKTCKIRGICILKYSNEEVVELEKKLQLLKYECKLIVKYLQKISFKKMIIKYFNHKRSIVGAQSIKIAKLEIDFNFAQPDHT